MKRLFLIPILALCLFSCQEKDPGGTNNGNGSTELNDYQKWILNDVMKKRYLWYDQIPSSVNNKLDWEEFFHSLCVSADGKDGYHYSYIERESTSSAQASKGVPTALIEGESYGFEYGVVYNETRTPGTTYYYFKILYVLPGSPAALKGITREHAIVRINGDEITDRNYDEMVPLLTSGSNVRFDLVHLTATAREDAGFVRLTSTTGLEDHPIRVDTVVTVGSHKIAYLHYTQFASGLTTSEHDYDDDLKDVFRKFVAKQATDLVVDLRYNPGGQVTCCQLLTSMIAPQSVAAGNEATRIAFATLTYNAKTNPQSEKWPFLTEDEMSLSSKRVGTGSGAGTHIPGLNKVYVIVSNWSASASELLINALDGVDFEAIRVGGLTEGKNVGSVLYEKTLDGYKYSARPITFSLSNNKGFGAYSGGLSPTPGFECTEFAQDASWVWKELGDPEELLFARAIADITGQPVAQASRVTKAAGTQAAATFTGKSSLDRKKPYGGNLVVPAEQ